ncbi:hypothetical protein K438DRAFT_527505 [Mycena galopus ATCC 62051]|nr:hypothetical protein K438DRAFT_527505 [Mycena galopus ATCC 62051]
MLYLGSSKLAVAQGSWLLWIISNFSARWALTGIVTTIFVPNQSPKAAPFVAVACGDHHFRLANISGSSDPSLGKTATHEAMLRMSNGNCSSPAAVLV